jgi:hypothetical protein
MVYQQKDRVVKTTAKSQKGWGCEDEPYPYCREDTDTGTLTEEQVRDILWYQAQVGVVYNNTDVVTNTDSRVQDS